MAPRQRLSPQPSLEEFHQSSSNESTSRSESPPPPSRSATNSSSTRPLLSSSNERRCNDKFNQSNNNNIINALDAADVSRERHDLFNLIALLFVIASTAVDWDLPLLFSGYGAGAFGGDYFFWTWGTSIAYFMVDLIWVSLVPHCVKSPGTIVKHHLLVVAYLFGPLFFPKYRWFMGACLSVEINTWFLILRRVVYKRKIRFLTGFVSAWFYFSWVVVRCFVYPAIMYTFVQLAIQRVRETNQLWHGPMIFMPVHFVLCVLNLKWSYDLFMPIFKSWFAKDATAPTISSGL